MALIWSFQIASDLLLIGLAIVWFRERTRLRLAHDEARAVAGLNVLEARAKGQEAEWRRLLEQVEVEFRRLQRIGDHAQRILDKTRQTLSGMAPTLEESELKAVTQGPEKNVVPDAAIPSLKELERTRDRLRTESGIDLKSLLKEQLV